MIYASSEKSEIIFYYQVDFKFSKLDYKAMSYIFTSEKIKQKIQSIFYLRGVMEGSQAFFYNRFAVYIARPVFSVFEMTLHDKLSKAKRVLDVGTGPGHFPILLGEIYPDLKIIGVDLSDDMLSEATKALKRSGLTNVTFKKGDAMNLPFPNNHFDIVTSNFSIKHWPDRVKGLCEIYRVLKKGGVAWIIEAMKDSPDSSMKNLIHFLNPIQKILVFPILRYVVFPQSIALDEATNYLKLSSFKKGEFRPVHNFPVLYALVKK